MALFRKSRKANDAAAAERRAKAEAEHNQAKWDELERLVSSQANPPELQIESTEPLASLNFDSLDSANSSELETPPFMSDLNIDLDLNTESDFKTDMKTDLDIEAVSADVIREELYVDPSMTQPLSSETEVTADDPIMVTDVEPPQPIPLDSFVPPPALARPDRADIGTMKLDVARISADIQSGEELYRRAQQRIENLTGFVERAEVDFSMLDRLEPENRRLKARNRTIEREISATIQKMDVLRNDLEDRDQRLAEKTRAYDTALGKLSTTQKSLKQYERALHTTRESSDRNALNAERLQTSLDVERRENEVLRDRVNQFALELDEKQNAYIEARKIADSLAQDCADRHHEAEAAIRDADDLRKSLATAKTQNNAMKSEMLSLHEDIRAFKAQSEFTIISREDEMTALQLQVDHLKKQLNIKDDITRNTASELQELRKIRTAQDLERERLEAQIEAQSHKLDTANSELLKTKQDVTDFDRRYRDVATALSVSQAKRMSNAPAETPDIQPVTEEIEIPSSILDQSEPEINEVDLGEIEDISEDEISNRVMDFRLGLRKDIS